MLKRRRHSKVLSQTAHANRRRRMLVNAKKKIFARHRAFVQLTI